MEHPVFIVCTNEPTTLLYFKTWNMKVSAAWLRMRFNIMAEYDFLIQIITLLKWNICLTTHSFKGEIWTLQWVTTYYRKCQLRKGTGERLWAWRSYLKHACSVLLKWTNFMPQMGNSVIACKYFHTHRATGHEIREPPVCTWKALRRLLYFSRRMYGFWKFSR